MIRCTFQLTPGVGPWRERQLWAAGVTRWEAFPAAPAAGISPRLDGRLREAIARAGAALQARDAGALAGMLPVRERWRLYAEFEEEAGFLDVECDGEALTAVGILDREGPRIFLRGRDLEEFPARAAGWKLLVTYNGGAFDLPALARAFPGWRPPRAHVDLRHLWARLGHDGGLKLLEDAAGMGRPERLRGLDGLGAVALWRRAQAGDRDALRLFAEYNLYDAVNLKALLALGYDRMLERFGLPAAPVRRWERGDVLYDLTREVLRIA